MIALATISTETFLPTELFLSNPIQLIVMSSVVFLFALVTILLVKKLIKRGVVDTRKGIDVMGITTLLSVVVMTGFMLFSANATSTGDDNRLTNVQKIYDVDSLDIISSNMKVKKASVTKDGLKFPVTYEEDKETFKPTLKPDDTGFTISQLEKDK